MAAALTALLAACAEQPSATPEQAGQPTLAGTAQPEAAQTIQAEVEATAAWVATQMALEATMIPLATPVTPAPPVTPGTVPPGVQITALRGACPIPQGYTLHERFGFCIAAPESWVALNMDGVGSAALSTTPGQAISLEMDSVAGGSTCQLTIYIADLSGVYQHLNARYNAISGLADLAEITPIGVQTLGDVLITGFTYRTTGGEAGAVYAEQISSSRLVHISYRGTACPPDLLTVLGTLRFN